MQTGIGYFTAAVNGNPTGRTAFAAALNCRAMNTSAILARINERLSAMGLTAAAASRQAGLTVDAIRNLKRGVKDGKGGSTIRTISALAPILGTSTSWLLDGVGEPNSDSAFDI